MGDLPRFVAHNFANSNRIHTRMWTLGWDKSIEVLHLPACEWDGDRSLPVSLGMKTDG